MAGPPNSGRDLAQLGAGQMNDLSSAGSAVYEPTTVLLTSMVIEEMSEEERYSNPHLPVPQSVSAHSQLRSFDG
jgi:hypothetical protein